MPAWADGDHAIPNNIAKIGANQHDPAAWRVDKIKALSNAKRVRWQKAGGMHSWEYNHDY